MNSTGEAGRMIEGRKPPLSIFLPLLLYPVILILIACSSVDAADRPNIVVIMADEKSEITEQRTNQNGQRSREVSSHGSDIALASKEELYLDRKLAFANPEVDNPNLPNVLLIGDSISIGYTAYVRRDLIGKADVYRIPTNAKNSAYGLEHLNDWLEMKSLKWDVIHFNWGLWDLCYRHPESNVQGNRDKVNGTLTESLEGYRSNMKKIVARLKQTDATLIWCTTTPVPTGEAGRKLGDDVKYNLVAAEIMKANKVRMNDLHSHARLRLPETMVRKGDVHFTEEGYIHLGSKVAEEVSAAIAKRAAD
ncbi:SGNH/GDSL hydrolase family protein [Rhodopirellula sp. JC740]|uniref:SGNH/GDSL hydrolase family protein n=1 Tax=Rhodopirellula halodulae TaxID=2894198 RepID=A0ABS8NG18_9BACT|nr:SGNH/GDSL hydrolase family protein [Rhodopirellula sp. JC740]MCC9642490.1 SGNH/GDSL hydrolase family protein [Rhodopirellula sp. JC740]